MATPLRILFLNYDSEDVRLLEQELRRAGFEPAGTRANTLEQFVAQLDWPVDLIVAEACLPQLTAVDALHRLRQRGLDTPLIVISAALEENIVVTSLSEGAADYLCIDRLARLGPAVNRALEGQRLKEEGRRAEQQCAQLAALVESSEDAVLARTLDHVVNVWNRAAERLFGYTAQEVLGRPLPDLIPSDRIEELQSVMDRVRRGEHVPPFDTERIRKDGRRIEVSVSLSPVKDAAGTVTGISTIARDITERKEKQQLTIQRDALQSLLQLHIGRMPLVCILFNADFRVTDWNPAAERTFGYTRQEALGKQPNDLNPPSFHRSALKLMEQIQAGDMRAHSVNENRTKDGRTIICEWFNTPLLTDDGRFSSLLCLGRDVTEQKQVEAERERLHQEVRASQELLAMLSRRLIEAQETERRHIAQELHDEIGQILTTINLNLESLRSDVSPAAQHRIDESVQIIDRAIEQVRNLSLDLRPASLDLLGLEITLRGYLTRQAARAGLTLEFNSNLASRRLSSTLETVCFRFVQEAMTNVVRHAQAKRSWVTLRATEDQLRVIIRDDGIGFDSALVNDRIMRGEGFGLLSMQERVQLHGGKMAFDSGPGRGTTLRADLALTAPSPREKSS
jgi:PAS domain S-box-containing protein